MPTTVTIHVDGLQQLGERLSKLAAKVATKSAVRATGAAAQLVRKAAKDNIKRSPSIVTGTLLDAVILKKLPKSQSTLTSEHIVTVRRAKRWGSKAKTKQVTAPHATFIEFGTVNMPAEPFLRPALERNVQPAIDVMKARLTEEIFKAGG